VDGFPLRSVFEHHLLGGLSARFRVCSPVKMVDVHGGLDKN
jgi:hypothetical protein